MKMELAEVEDGIVNVTLAGRLDTPGVSGIETRLTASIVPRAARAIVDLSQVEFAGSLAIRMFITLSRAVGRRNGKLVLYAPQPSVRQVFEAASLNEIVPICEDERA